MTTRTLKPSYFLTAVCCFGFAGCASFLGTTTYSPLETATTEAIETLATVSDVEGQQQAESRTQLANSREPSTTAGDETASINMADISAKRAPAASEENPFAVMAREKVKQTSLTLPEMPDMDPGFAAFAAAANAASSASFEAPPRLPTGQPCCPIPLDATIAASPVAQAYPDEYIFDGGDRDHPVHYYGGEMQGLDTEDTVAEFKDHLGDNHVQPSNRVAVYAPRFGAVETVSGLKMDVKIDKAVGANNTSGFGELHEEKGLITEVDNSGAVGVATRRGASGVETAESPLKGTKVDGVVQAEKVDQGMEAQNRTGPGTLETTDIRELSIQILEPLSSESDTIVASRGSTTQATLTYSTFKPAATVGMEKRGRKGELLLTKEATPLVAKPGETITFQIQFKNVGDYNVEEVKIIDNLTPRLIYVDGTGEIEVSDGSGGGLVLVPNKEGSQTLIFELDEPLRGGESGSITFKALVR